MAEAIKSYHELGMQMEVFGAQSRAWSKEGQKMAEQWEQVWEKTKQIQINFYCAVRHPHPVTIRINNCTKF